jgi:hypothetical protein
MKHRIPRKPPAPGNQLQFFSRAALLIILFVSVPASYASTVDECLLEALKKADYSVTVGQLHEQCTQETGKNLIANPSPDRSAGENAGSNGPAEVILKTSLAKKPAYFPHKRHQDKYACGTCHHGKDSSDRIEIYDEETVIYRCTTCHNADMPNKELNSFQAIGHTLCRECHKTHQDTTSAKCSTCHRENL